MEERSTQKKSIESPVESKGAGKEQNLIKRAWKNFAAFAGAIAVITTLITNTGTIGNAIGSAYHHIFPSPLTVKATQPLPRLGTILYTHYTSQKNIVDVAWSPDGRRIADMTADGTLQVWGAMSGQTPISYVGRKPSQIEMSVLAWSPDGTRIAFMGTDGSVQVWLADRSSMAESFSIDFLGLKLPVDGLAWSPDGQYLAIGDDNGDIGVLDLSYWQGSTRLKYPGTGPVFAWSPDSKELAIAGYATEGPSQIEVLNISSSPSAHNQTYPVAAIIIGLAWSPNGKYLALSTLGPYIWPAIILDVTNQSGAPQSLRVRSVSQAWACDSNRVAFSDVENRAVTIWDRASDKPLFRFTDIVGPGPSDWSPDGMYIASGSEDGRILVWQASQENLCSA